MPTKDNNDRLNQNVIRSYKVKDKKNQIYDYTDIPKTKISGKIFCHVLHILKCCIL